MKFSIPRDCRHWSCVPSPLSRTQSGARHQGCFQRPPPEKASRGPRSQQHDSKHVEMPSSLSAQRHSISWQRTQSSKTGPSCQGQLKHTSESISGVAAYRRLGTRPTYPGTHSQQTQHMCRGAHVSPQPEQPATLRHQHHSEAAQEERCQDWPLHCTYSVQPHTFYRTCPGPMSAWKQEYLLSPPRTLHWTGHTSSTSL